VSVSEVTSTEPVVADQWLTVEDVMRVARLGQTRAGELMDSLPSFRYGRRRYIRASDLNAFTERLVSGEIDGAALAVSKEERAARVKNPGSRPRPKRVAE
jgi:hypothetical protein